MLDDEDARKEHLLLALLARAAETQGATREQAIGLARESLASRLGTQASAERTLAMFDEVEAAARAERPRIARADQGLQLCRPAVSQPPDGAGG